MLTELFYTFVYYVQNFYSLLIGIIFCGLLHSVNNVNYCAADLNFLIAGHYQQISQTDLIKGNESEPIKINITVFDRIFIQKLNDLSRACNLTISHFIVMARHLTKL